MEVQSALLAEERKAEIAKGLERWYRLHAETKLYERIGILAGKLGMTPSGVLVRDQESRWGSCSPGGVPRFNWRIIVAPLPLVDYAVAHELCHLLHPNHGPSFERAPATSTVM